MNKDYNLYEYQMFELLLQAKNNTIDDVVKEEIKKFEELNKYKIEQYNIYLHLKGGSLKC
jgi:hypothetical protein